MKMTTPDNVLERIRKLLALASSANEHEASAAMRKAHGLLAEYNLTEADLGTPDEHGFIVDGELHTLSRPWRRKLAANVARLYFAEYVYGFVKVDSHTRKCGYTRFDKHQFYGAPHNVAVAKSMFVYLCDTIDRLAMEAADAREKKGRESFMTSFRHGCANRLVERLAERWGEATTLKLTVDPTHKTTLPALYEQTKAALNDFIEQNGGSKVVPFNPKLHSMEGAIAGYQKGDSVGLDAQLENPNARAFILEDGSK